MTDLQVKLFTHSHLVSQDESEDTACDLCGGAQGEPGVSVTRGSETLFRGCNDCLVARLGEREVILAWLLEKHSSATVERDRIFAWVDAGMSTRQQRDGVRHGIAEWIEKNTRQVKVTPSNVRALVMAEIAAERAVSATADEVAKRDTLRWREGLPSEDKMHACSLKCDGQDGRQSVCARIRRKLGYDR